jgi:putative transposase
MKRKRYTEEQIVYALKQAETGVKVAELIRTMGGSASRHSTDGRSNTPVWALVNSGSCGSCAKRTPS